MGMMMCFFLSKFACKNSQFILDFLWIRLFARLPCREVEKILLKQFEFATRLHFTILVRSSMPLSEKCVPLCSLIEMNIEYMGNCLRAHFCVQRRERKSIYASNWLCFLSDKESHSNEIINSQSFEDRLQIATCASNGFHYRRRRRHKIEGAHSLIRTHINNK